MGPLARRRHRLHVGQHLGDPGSSAESSRLGVGGLTDEPATCSSRVPSIFGVNHAGTPGLQFIVMSERAHSPNPEYDPTPYVGLALAEARCLAEEDGWSPVRVVLAVGPALLTADWIDNRINLEVNNQSRVTRCWFH